jgi:hypothetical protein
MMKVVIRSGSMELEAVLEDNETGRGIAAALPIEGRANTWGDEIYFAIAVDLDQAEDARADMEVGELAYWPVGSAFCIFFGRTPASTSDAPRAASPVNPFGLINGDATSLRQVGQGDPIRVEAVE